MQGPAAASRESVWTDNIDLSVKSVHEERSPNASPPGGSVNADQDPNFALLGDGLGLGEPSPKPILDHVDLVVFLISIVCCALTIMVVTTDQIAWHLTYTYQLVLIGFLLSLMATCLKNTAPTLLLLCEIRFGASKLQNMDAIRTSDAFSSRVDWWWRATIVLLTALPIGLSASYKLFPGGMVKIQIKSDPHMYNETFGINAPPQLLPLGWNTGVLLMSNATIPFLTASTNQSATTDAALGDVANDCPLPGSNQAYGFNTLLINSQTAALLDSPPPTWIEEVQAKIGKQDAVEIEADVLATVSTFNEDVNQHRAETDPWWNYPPGAVQGMWETQVPLTGSSYFWLRWKSPTDFDTTQAAACFISLVNGNSTNAMSAYMFNTTRRNCHGQWRITKGAVHLTDGYCNTLDTTGGLLNESSQMVFTNWHGLSLSTYFPDLLAEITAPFLWKNNSQWAMPTIAVAVASMYWSRAAASIGPSSPHWLGNNSYNTNDDHNVPVNIAPAGITYTSAPIVYWGRPAIRKSPWLFLVICAPPLIIAAILSAIAALYRVAIGRRFGLVSVLAGMERDSLPLLRGAGFSGKLRRPAYLGIAVQEAENGGRKAAMRYRLRSTRPMSQGEMKRKVVLS